MTTTTHSFTDGANRTWTACCECARGGNGHTWDKCSCGGRVKYWNGAGCYLGAQIPSRNDSVIMPRHADIILSRYSGATQQRDIKNG